MVSEVCERLKSHYAYEQKPFMMSRNVDLTRIYEERAPLEEFSHGKEITSLLTIFNSQKLNAMRPPTMDKIVANGIKKEAKVTM